MRKGIIIITGIIVYLFSISANAAAIEVAPRITDREIIEKLTRLEEGQNKLQQQIADTNRRIDELKDFTGKQIADLKDSTNKQIGDLKDFMLWGFGILFAGMFTLVGFVLWDRRTALSPAIKKNKELEERDDKLEKALKEYAHKEPRLAEILRNVGIM
ncbi:MAG: hypothetical protein HY279_14735 [Nitrospinae bacterium]|nr:hypothetical protein [Nitrospinota bacterium]